MRFVLAAVLVSVLSAVVGVSVYANFGVIPATLYWSTWLSWYGSVVIGIVLITPFLVYSVRDWPSLVRRIRYLEYAAGLIALGGAAFLWQGPVFLHNVEPNWNHAAISVRENASPAVPWRQERSLNRPLWL